MKVLTSPAVGTEPTLTVGDLARAAGIAASAVRFYDDNGLLASVRTAGNQRRFHPIDACLVKIIRVAQRAGLSVAEIRALMTSLPARRGEVTVVDFGRLRDRLEADVRERIAALTNVLDDLTSTQKLCDVPTEQAGWSARSSSAPAAAGTAAAHPARTMPSRDPAGRRPD